MQVELWCGWADSEHGSRSSPGNTTQTPRLRGGYEPWCEVVRKCAFVAALAAELRQLGPLQEAQSEESLLGL